MRTHLLMATAVAAALLAATSSTRAQNWTGTISSDWFNAGNWIGAGVPTGATSPTIDTVTPNATVVGTPGAMSGLINIGVSGTGALTSQNGGTLSDITGAVGNSPILGAVGHGTVTVTGAGSTWTNTADLVLGNIGLGTTGMLTIADGGTVSSGRNVEIGPIGGQGTVTVTGAGSTLTNNGNGVFVGIFGTGALTIANGGTVTASGALGTTVAQQSGSTGTVNLNSGGILQTRALTAGSGTARVNFDGGTLRALASVPGFVTGFSGAALNIASGGLTIDDAGFTVATGASFSGAGALSKIGSGTLTLSGANTYTGPTTVDAGALIVNGSIASSSLTTVNSGATLSGSGTVGSTIINNGGTLAPGGIGTPGTITLGPLTFNSGSRLSYQLGTPNVIGGPTNDLTNVNGALTVNGDTLFVTNSSGFTLGTYRLINYTLGTTPGGSGQLVIGTLPDGLTGSIETSIPGQVNLIVTPPLPTTQFWNGSTLVGDGVVHGGDGTWNNTLTNWTTSTGTVNTSWQGNMAVFEGAAGTVTVADPIAYQGLQFSTGGYVVTASGGGVLMPTGVAPIIVDGGLAATIAAPIAGSGV